MCLRKHKANLQPPSAVYGGLDQALARKEWLCATAPIVPKYRLALMQQNENALLIQHVSKMTRQQGFMRKSVQRYNSLAWQDKLTLVVFEMCILHYHDVTLQPCYWHQGLNPSRTRPWTHAELQLARPWAPSLLYQVLQYILPPHWSSPQTANIPPSLPLPIILINSLDTSLTHLR